MIKLSLRLPLPGLHNSVKETFTVANLKPEPGQDIGYLQFSNQGQIGYRNADEPNYQYPHPEWIDYTGPVWAMSTQQQYMFQVVNGELTTVAALNESEDIRSYLKHVRLCQEHAVGLPTYLHLHLVYRLRTTNLSRRPSRTDSDWQKVKYFRQRFGFSIEKSKAFIRAEQTPDNNLPVRVQDIVDYASR